MLKDQRLNLVSELASRNYNPIALNFIR